MSEEYPNAIDVENWNRLPDAMKRSRIKAYMDMCDKLNQIFAMEELRRPPLPIIVNVDDDGVTHFEIEHAMEINTSNPVLEQIQALEKEIDAIITPFTAELTDEDKRKLDNIVNQIIYVSSAK